MSNKQLQIMISSVLSAMAVTFFSIDIISDLNSRISKLEVENSSLSDRVAKHEESLEVMVTATMYYAQHHLTDSTPNILADGTMIEVDKAGQYRYVALSRDLLSRWGGPFDYGDYILVEGTKNKKWDGMWQIRDTMAVRWKKRIDFLCSFDTDQFKFENVKIKLVSA